jgi:transcription initiation factor TFIIIB Brf1 subunit/transcription initiation factor TFIIB
MAFTQDDVIERTNSLIDDTPQERLREEAKEEIKEEARGIIESAFGSPKLSGHPLDVIAASAFYLAALQTENRVTQKAVGEVADVSTFAIRNCYKKMYICWKADLAGISYERAQSLTLKDLHELAKENKEEQDE